MSNGPWWRWWSLLSGLKFPIEWSHANTHKRRQKNEKAAVRCKRIIHLVTCVNKSKSLQLRFIHYSCKNCNEKSCREWKTNYFVRFYLPNVTFLQYQRSALIKYFNFVFFRSTLHQFFNQSLKFCFDTSQTVWLKIENKQITKDDWGWWNLNKLRKFPSLHEVLRR